MSPYVCVQELSLLQPWCPGVTATTAMQRTMSVYSNQFATIRAAAAADKPLAVRDGATQVGAAAAAAGAAAAATGQGAVGNALDSAVLSIMGASLQAMWDAVGEEGMRPFVVRGLRLSHCALFPRGGGGQSLAHASLMLVWDSSRWCQYGGICR